VCSQLTGITGDDYVSNTMSKSRPPELKVPTGSYCYGYVAVPSTGFQTRAAVDAYLQNLPLEKQMPELSRLTQRLMCPYWRMIDHGRVRCNLTGKVAPGINGRKAALSKKFYRKHPKADLRETGFLLADAVKECRINRDGVDFAFPFDQSIFVIEPKETLAAGTSPK